MQTRQGLIYGILAYGFWGLVPIYFRSIRALPSDEILAHRIVWSAMLLGIIVTVARRWRDVARCLADWRLLLPLLLSAMLIAINWLAYIKSVADERIVEASLGYFITPLFQVMLGVAIGERMRPLQIVALLLATSGVLAQVVALGEIPWFALTLATSFSLYALVRKKTPVDGLLGLTVETFLLAPVAAYFLIARHTAGTLTWGSQSFGLDLLVAASGIVTTIPLLCFGQAARRLPLSTLGFLQFLAPTIQFLIAVFAFGEPFSDEKAVSFAIVWCGVGVFLYDSIRRATRRS